MTPAPLLGASLSSPPPDFPPQVAAQALAQHYGMTGTLTALTSERDVNYKLTTTGGDFVVKLANPAEPAEVTRLQTRALIHLEASNLPVPRVIRTLQGAPDVALPQGILRVLTYLEGSLMHRAAPSPALRSAVGDMAARLSRGLQGFSDPAAGHVLQWDIKQAAALRPMLPDVPADLRGAGQATLDRFDRDIAPQLPNLRWQVVHNDLNPHNILTGPTGETVTGILDFGDMVRTPLVCDLAVAASYLIDAAQPMTSLIQVAAAYHAVLPLLHAEAALLIALTQTRFVTTLCITGHRAKRYPENAPYILRNVQRSRAGLLALGALDQGGAVQSLLTALRLP